MFLFKFRIIGPIGVALAGILLAGCNPPQADTPSAEELSQLFRIPVTDVSCVPADGKPGVVCDFKSTFGGISRRLVKQDDGTWRGVTN